MRQLFRRTVGFPKQRCIARIPHVQHTTINDKIVKGFHLGIPEPSGGFGKIMGLRFQKGVDIIGTNGIQISFSVNPFKPAEQIFVTVDGPLFMV